MRIKLALLALIMTAGLTTVVACGDQEADTAEESEITSEGDNDEVEEVTEVGEE